MYPFEYETWKTLSIYFIYIYILYAYKYVMKLRNEPSCRNCLVHIFPGTLIHVRGKTTCPSAQSISKMASDHRKPPSAVKYWFILTSPAEQTVNEQSQ